MGKIPGETRGFYLWAGGATSQPRPTGTGRDPKQGFGVLLPGAAKVPPFPRAGKQHNNARFGRREEDPISWGKAAFEM